MQTQIKRIQPPAVFYCLLACCLLLKLVFPGFDFLPSGVRILAGPLLLVMGMILVLGSWAQLRNKGTAVHPQGEISALLEEGLFRFSRNPMYLGYTLLLLAVAVLLGSGLALICVPVFFFAMDQWQIPFEEERLRIEMGQDYVSYCTRVRRWV